MNYYMIFFISLSNLLQQINYTIDEVPNTLFLKQDYRQIHTISACTTFGNIYFIMNTVGTEFITICLVAVIYFIPFCRNAVVIFVWFPFVFLLIAILVHNHIVNIQFNIDISRTL